MRYLSPDTSTEELLVQTYNTMRELHAHMSELSDIQWEAAPVPASEGGSGKGGLPADPTGNAALDPRRLGARSAFNETRRQLNIALTALSAAKYSANQAISDYYKEMQK